MAVVGGSIVVCKVLGRMQSYSISEIEVEDGGSSKEVRGLLAESLTKPDHT